MPHDHQILVITSISSTRLPKTSNISATIQIDIRKDYASFSIFGIAMILAFGGLIVLINLLLEPVVRFLRKRTSMGEGAYRQLEWDLMSTLQLQRLVYEGQGTGRSEGEVDDIPVTAERVGIPQWPEAIVGHDRGLLFGNGRFATHEGELVYWNKPLRHGLVPPLQLQREGQRP